MTIFLIRSPFFAATLAAYSFACLLLLANPPSTFLADLRASSRTSAEYGGFWEDIMTHASSVTFLSRRPSSPSFQDAMIP